MRAAVSIMAILVLGAAPAAADEILQPDTETLDRETCKTVRREPVVTKVPDPLPSALPPEPGKAYVPEPPRPLDDAWNDFDIAGELRDPEPVVRELFAVTMGLHQKVSERDEIAKLANVFGYHIVGLTVLGRRAQLHLAPMPMVRRVEVDVQTGLFGKLYVDEIKRRISLRTGGYLPWRPDERQCVLDRERLALERYLADDGYFDAEVNIDATEGETSIVKIRVDLKDVYTVDKVDIVAPDGVTIAPSLRAKAEDKFKDPGNKLLGVQISKAHYTKAQYEADKQKVIELFQQNQYPSVRLTEKVKPTPDRQRHTVSFTIEVDPRRNVDVRFDGADGIASAATLLEKTTFNLAQSADELEIQNSAKSVLTFLQSRGYFDARVTALRSSTDDSECKGSTARGETRSDVGAVDHVRFCIAPGPSREVKAVSFSSIGHVISDGELSDVIATRPAQLAARVLGASTSATTSQLAADAESIRKLYVSRGYRDAKVRATASPDPSTLTSAAATAAVVMSDRGGGLYVRFAIEEGPLSTLASIRVELRADQKDPRRDEIRTPADGELCKRALDEIVELYRVRGQVEREPGNSCAVDIIGVVPYREGVALGASDQLRDKLFVAGLPRADVKFAAVDVDKERHHRFEARYTLDNTQKLVVGKVVIRGNFRTRESLIRKLLRVREDQLLTRDLFAEGARRMRNTGLFDSVNISLPDLRQTSGEMARVHALVEVTERYDFFSTVDAEIGYSSYNGAFLKLLPSFKNITGRGISLDLAGTVGLDLGEAFSGNLVQRQLSGEATLRFPRYLVDWAPIEFETEITALHDSRETARFGRVVSSGASLALSRTIERPRIGTRPARALTFGLHYDLRRRERNVDVLRPIGADEDDSQVPITTRTGAVGATVEWEQRVDRRGTLQPLAPEAGFRLEGSFSFASPYLFGQDTFIKLSGAASKFLAIGDNLVLRGDLRYDHGFPLGDAALLPEVERFFGGGDNTVRGYNDDRLATEIVLVGVPPLDNVQQIRILPAGGNIRALASIDAQLRIWKVFATGAFLDAGIITNQWTTASLEDVRPSVGVALFRIITPFGSFVWERAIPLRPRLGDDPRGRWHINFAARAQF